MNPDALLGRIRKLLAMAEAEGLSEAARETYNSKAAELIAQYGIDRALVEEASPHRVEAADLVVAVDPPYARDKISLLAGIAAPLGCRLVYRTEQRAVGTGHSAHLFGMDADIHRVQMLFTSLLVQQAQGLALARPPRQEDPRAFRRSWMAGFAVAVAERLTRTERMARERAQTQQTQTRENGSDRPSTTPSVAVVLANRSQRVDAHLARAYPRLRAPRTRQLSGSGGRAGYQAGERADLGLGSRVSSRVSPAIGMR
ncbi:hypothetical protein ThrDRAFT_00823 [Frankia casuarinae]|uniref:Uncharacterized protein n=2 Tax=Frankia casuarinae (strain DSM 45818 / CECT 9043 / HFP020203 / CcI3) TaxID=106370 RepID=Q2J6Z1_FRACC|nr:MULTISPECIES: DUF2786 domain-containing protein [Frankia]ABD12951.1 conserved hypothetical protein [Frankia casuarinae]ETA03555.1 hypothetical protein CcI6DRAFT_01001 [Frankia sp. CcI6]EYT93494.1 hypothetical protein ThrDRAFT_00823 [Frankia casuarinae]KDA43743.1 hypothetical protein BMG523Draft_01404 [Frankia sp. BMG5.23]OAA26123.1 Protein of unknown function (DUF2786) [Frankia casuarinae]